MQVLHYQKKNAHLNKVERYYIHAEFTANNHLNDRTSFPMQSPKDPPAVINTLPLTPPPSDRSHGHWTCTLPTLARLPPRAHKSLKRKVQQWHCIKAGLRSPAKSYAVRLYSTIHCSFSTTRFEQHTGYLRWIVRKSHSILRTSWATGHQPPRQLKFLPPTSKYLATIHPVKLIITRTSHHPISFHAVQNGHDPPCLVAHTHLPLDYACQEADQHTTHQSTASN